MTDVRGADVGEQDDEATEEEIEALMLQAEGGDRAAHDRLIRILATALGQAANG